MTSNIDVTVPSSPIALTRDVRRNFEVIKKEIEALQVFMANLGTSDSPNFTGTIHGAAETLTGDLAVGGNLTVGAGIFSTLEVLDTSIPLTLVFANTNFVGNLRKITTQYWWLAGRLANNTGAPVGNGITKWASFPGVMDIGIQMFPAAIFNSATFPETVYLQLIQNGVNTDVYVSTFTGGAGVPVPTFGTIAFNLLLRMVP